MQISPILPPLIVAGAARADDPLLSALLRRYHKEGMSSNQKIAVRLLRDTGGVYKLSCVAYSTWPSIVS